MTRIKVAPRDAIILASDGLNGLGLAGIDRVTRAATTRDVNDVPQLVLDEARKRGGLMDDATAVIVRV